MLAVRVNTTKRDKSARWKAWEEILTREPAGDTFTLPQVFIRLPGVSRTGPCPICAQYFYMEHDGSGKDVPVIPLHVNCVCRDLPKQVLDASAGPSPQTYGKKGEWLKDNPDRAAKIVGPTRARMLASGAARIKDLYESQTTPLSRPRNLAALASRLLRLKSKTALIAAARQAGVTAAETMTRGQLIDAIAGRAIR